MCPTEVPSAPWHRVTLRHAGAIGPVIEAVLNDMAALGYPVRDITCTRLGLEIALVQALLHIHQGNVASTVQLRYQVQSARVLFDIEHAGRAFLLLANAGGPERSSRQTRAMRMLHAHMSTVHVSANGDRVMLCRDRSQESS
jgi:hypothetical protein